MSNRVHPVDRRRRSEAIRSGLASLYGQRAVKRWAAFTPPSVLRAQAQEQHEWERVSFGLKSPTQLAAELGCHRRTVVRARMRLHMPEAPPMETMVRARKSERIDWERVSFGGKSRKQVAEELGCKHRTAILAARRLHIPLQKVPPRRPKHHNRGRPKGSASIKWAYTPSILGRAPGVLGGQALELQRRKQREAHHADR